MDTTSFERSFRYDAWANRKILTALRETPGVDARARQIMAHLLAAQKVWLTRLHGQDTAALAIWPELSLEACGPMLEENQHGYQQFLAALTPARMEEPISYRTSTGAAFQTAIVDILTQVLLHGAYHRGQLAIAIKRAGNEPPFTDFILFTRET